MKLEVIGSYYQPDVIDCWTFVTNEQDPRTGYRTMLASDYDGRMFSQFTESVYDPNGPNEHLGRWVCAIGKYLVEHVAGRMAE
jgi:hypothetical protein